MGRSGRKYCTHVRDLTLLLRRLHPAAFGLLDRWYAASHDANSVQAFCLCLHCAFRTGSGARHGRSQIPQLHSLVLEAVRRCLAELPILRCAITRDLVSGEPGGYRELNDAMSLASAQVNVHRAGETSVDALVKRRCQTGFVKDNNCLPLFVDVVETQCSKQADVGVDILFTLHHAHCDGMAGVDVISAFCRHLDAAFAGAPPKAPVPVSVMSPSLECLVDLRPTVQRIATGEGRMFSVARCWLTHAVTWSWSSGPDVPMRVWRFFVPWCGAPARYLVHHIRTATHSWLHCMTWYARRCRGSEGPAAVFVPQTQRLAGQSLQCDWPRRCRFAAMSTLLA